MASKVLDPANPVFKERNASSKIQTVIEKLNDVRNNYKETGVMEKAVIVSQWTSMLNVLKIHVKEMGFKVCEINGQIPVSKTDEIFSLTVEKFLLSNFFWPHTPLFGHIL